MNSNLQCVVPGCPTSANQGIRFYPFPIFNLEICSIWERRVRGTAAIEIDPLTAQICELHFHYRCKTGKDCALDEKSLPAINLPEFGRQSTDITHFHTSADVILETNFEISTDEITEHCRLCFSKGLLYQVQASTYRSISFLALLPSGIVPGDPPPNACLSCLKAIMIAQWLSRTVHHANTIFDSLRDPENSKVVLNRYGNSLDIKSEMASCNLIPAYPITTASKAIESKLLKKPNGRKIIDYKLDTGYITNQANENCCDAPQEADDSSPAILDSGNYRVHPELQISKNRKLHAEGSRRPGRKCNKGFPSTTITEKRNKQVHAGDFMCLICNQFKVSAKALASHLKAEHQFFQLDNCSQVWKHGETEIANKRQRSPTELFRCTHCSYTTRYRHHLPRHLVLHLSDAKRFHCTRCGKEFHQKNQLVRHARAHDKLEKPIRCGLCGEEFYSKHEHRQHKHKNCGIRTGPIEHDNMYWNEKDGVFVCPKCEWTHPSRKVFMVHFGKHGVEKKESKMKGKNSVESKEMKTIHTISKRNKEGKLKCNECPLTFRATNELLCHMRKHTGERPFECKLCHIAFKQAFHLKSHLYRIHSSDPKPLACTICKKKFKCVTARVMHMRSTHFDKLLKCEHCDKTYSAISSRNRHIKVAH